VSRWHTWVTLGAALGIVLILTNMVIFEWNRTLQREVDARAQYIQQTMQLEALQREIVSAIANLSVRNKDDALKAILTQQGITINVNPSQTTPAHDAKGRR
jgi:predicted Holliday junction resolvase-like endonuclease